MAFAWIKELPKPDKGLKAGKAVEIFLHAAKPSLCNMSVIAKAAQLQECKLEITFLLLDEETRAIFEAVQDFLKGLIP